MERDDRMMILVNLCISEVDKIGLRVTRKCWAERVQEGERQEASKFIRVVTINIAIEKGHCGDVSGIEDI